MGGVPLRNAGRGESVPKVATPSLRSGSCDPFWEMRRRVIAKSRGVIDDSGRLIASIFFPADIFVIKLLLLIPTLDRSGAEKQFTLLATGLPREEFEIEVVCLTRGGPYEAALREQEIPVTILHKRMKFDPVAFFRLKKLIGRRRPDVLHTWLFAANAYGRLAVGGKGRPRVLVSERCVDSWKQSWQLKLDQKLIPRTDRLIANSESVAGFYLEQGFPAERIVVIPNGVKTVTDPPLSETERNAILAEFDIPPGSRVVGYAGRLAPQKRGKDLIWSLQLLKQLTDRVYLVIVGDGPDRENLISLAKHMGCDNLVRFLGHRDDVPRLMRTFSTLWLASDFEGQSNSLMEAMARGIPVVASDIPANRELVVDGETGFVVKVGDCQGFSQFTDRILADPELANRLGEAARADAEPVRFGSNDRRPSGPLSRTGGVRACAESREPRGKREPPRWRKRSSRGWFRSSAIGDPMRTGLISVQTPMVPNRRGRLWGIGGCRSSTWKAAGSRCPTKMARSGSCSTARFTTTASMRPILESQGHRFHTGSDTETIVHLYEEYGCDCLAHLRGMFAFAIWDERKRRLFLARDRLGQKPLFYRQEADRFLFASELKSLLQIPEAPRTLDPRASMPICFTSTSRIRCACWRAITSCRPRTLRFMKMETSRSSVTGSRLTKMSSLLMKARVSEKRHGRSNVGSGSSGRR